MARTSFGVLWHVFCGVCNGSTRVALVTCQPHSLELLQANVPLLGPASQLRRPLDNRYFDPVVAREGRRDEDAEGAAAHHHVEAGERLVGHLWRETGMLAHEDRRGRREGLAVLERLPRRVRALQRLPRRGAAGAAARAPRDRLGLRGAWCVWRCGGRW